MTRAAPLIGFALWLAGCAIGDDPYPSEWGPLPISDSGCASFAGTYADVGERPAEARDASLTRELFGRNAPWTTAKAVRFEFPAEDILEVTVLGTHPKPFMHRFTEKAGDLQCAENRLFLRHRRWVYVGTVSGRESVRATLHESDGYLVMQVQERTSGMMFMAVPVVGESSRWYRFPRLP